MEAKKIKSKFLRPIFDSEDINGAIVNTMQAVSLAALLDLIVK